MEDQKKQSTQKSSGCLKGCLIALGICFLIIMIIISVLVFKGKDIAIYLVSRYETRISGNLGAIQLPEGYEKTFTPFVLIGMKSDVNAISYEGKDIEGIDYFRDYFIKDGWVLVKDFAESVTENEEDIPQFQDHEAFGIITMEKGDENLVIMSWSSGEKIYINIISGPKDLVHEGIMEYTD